MNYREAKAVVERIRYKPGVDVKLEFQYRQLVLTVYRRVPNSDDPASEILIQVSATIYEEELERHYDERALIGKVRDLFRELELHEVDEWLRLDGERVTDPHPRAMEAAT